MTDERPARLNHFAVFACKDAYWQLSIDEQHQLQREWVAALRTAAPAVHHYQTFPLECQGDFIVWTAVEVNDPATPAVFFADLARLTKSFRRYFRLQDALWGFTRRSPYSRSKSAQEMDPFDQQRRRYLVMYPFTKTMDWYAKDRETRQGIMNEHIRIGKQYRDIMQLLLYSVGLQDQEFVVVYETDDLGRFSQLVQELRSTEGRQYTKSDTPLHTGICQPPDAPFSAW